MATEHSKPTEGYSYHHERGTKYRRAMGARGTRMSLFGKLKSTIREIVSGEEEYDPFDPEQCGSTPEDAKRFAEYMDRYSMTHPEAQPMSNGPPF